MPTFSSQKFEKIPQSWRKMTIYPILSSFYFATKGIIYKMPQRRKICKMSQILH